MATTSCQTMGDSPSKPTQQPPGAPGIADVAAPPEIRTPDQRVRVFVSSTLQELAEERRAAREAIDHLRLTPVLFELGARPHPPRSLYRAYLDQSDVFIGIYWQRYGWTAPGEDVSGLEDEYRLAGGRPKLIYIKSPAPEREPGLRMLLQRIRDDDGVSYRSFSTADELRELIENDLALLLTERFVTGARAATAVLPAAARSDNLPALRGDLIGRASETAMGRQLLQDPDVGLVTLTGPGGSGKSRLAIHLAASLRDAFVDGVCFVPLATLADPQEIVPAMCAVLGVRIGNDDQPLVERLIDFLHPKRMLIVLDNFEHLLPAATLVTDLLTRCPKLTILATSRAPLHVRGEKELPVPPLDVPDPDALASLERLSRYPAVELFVQRAGDAQLGFVLTEETGPVVAEICARLDGLPLAIELAAARVRMLPPRALLARLDRRLPILTGGARDLPARQQTLRSAIGWSHDLLSEQERLLFRRLAVFPGGFNLEMAEAICQGSGLDSAGVLGGVESLLDENLLSVREENTGEPRFSMLETIREFGMEQLEASQDDVAVRRLHAAWSVQLAERAGAELIGHDQIAWGHRLDAEYPNIRAALEWSIASETSPETALRLASSIWRYWWSRGMAREGLTWLDRALAKPGSSTPDHRGRALLAAAELAEGLADYGKAESSFREAAALFESVSDQPGLAAALNGNGVVLRKRGAFSRAEELHERALEIMRHLDNTRGIASALNNLGGIAYFRGDSDRAEALWEETLRLVRSLGDHNSTSAILSNLGSLALMRGDAQRAVVLHNEALDLARLTGDVEGIGHVLANLANAKFESGDLAGAAAGYEEALKRCRGIGDVAGEGIILHDLGKVEESRGELRSAAERYADALNIFWKTGNLPRLATGLERLASIAVQIGMFEPSARRFAAASAIRKSTGAALTAADSAEYGAILSTVRAALGNAEFDVAWQAGTQLTPEQAVEEALAFACAEQFMRGQAPGAAPPTATNAEDAVSSPAPSESRVRTARRSSAVREGDRASGAEVESRRHAVRSELRLGCP